MHCSVKNAAVLRKNHPERVAQIWTSPYEEEEEEDDDEEEGGGSVLLRCFLAPLGVLFVMKTLEGER